MTKQEEKMRECISSLEKEERELQGRLDQEKEKRELQRRLDQEKEKRELQRRLDHVTLVLKEKRTLLRLLETCAKILANCEREDHTPLNGVS